MKKIQGFSIKKEMLSDSSVANTVQAFKTKGNNLLVIGEDGFHVLIDSYDAIELANFISNNFSRR